MTNLQVSTSWIDPDEIIWTKIICNSISPFRMKDAKDLIDTYIDMCEDNPRIFITDLREVEQPIDQNVIFYFATHSKMTILRDHQIFLTQALPGWFFASHFTNYVNKTFPCLVFSEEEEALEYLRSLL